MNLSSCPKLNESRFGGLILLALFILCAIMPSMRAAESDLVLHFDFGEGEGTVLHDRSGNLNDGTVHDGAQFVRAGRGLALQLNGVNGWVEIPATRSLDLTDQITVAAWIRPEGIPVGDAGIAGKAYDSFVLTYYINGNCYWYIGGGPQNCSAPLSLNSWQHVAGTFEGKVMKLYVNGRLAGQGATKEPKIPSGKEFFMGKSDGDVRYTQNSYFKGRISDLKVYRRALTEAEIAADYQASPLAHALEILPWANRLTGNLYVDLNAQRLSELPARSLAGGPSDAYAEVGIFELGQRQPRDAASASVPQGGTSVDRRDKPLRSQRVKTTGGMAEINLPVGDLAPGAYVLQAVASDTAGKPIGDPAVETVLWSGKPKFPDSTGGRPLNNLVIELLNVKPTASQKEFRFSNPRDGWVLVESTARVENGGRLRIMGKFSGAEEALAIHAAEKESRLEAMRFLPAGEQTLVVQTEGKADLRELVVRAIPELVYCQFQNNPLVAPCGPYDWKFLAKDVLRNCNCIIGAGEDAHRSYAEEWKKQGRKWIIIAHVPGLDGSAVSPESAFEAWSKNPGYQNPLYDGIIVDEFDGGDAEQYDGWTGGLKRLQQEPKFRGKTFYPFCGTMHQGGKSRRFIETIMNAGSRFAWEVYLTEQPTEARAGRFLEARLTEIVRAWEKVQPGAVQHMIVTLGYMSAPPESCNINPAVDYKVYMDMQFQLLATDPAFFGLAGIMEYNSGYADEETVRWAGRLFRHYGIEGKTALLSEEYGFKLMLDHLQNPDFDRETAGWKVEPAETGSVMVKTMPGLSRLWGRYPQTNQGNNFLWLKRSSARPNRISQTIRGLTPGRLYSLKMFVADHGDLSQGKSVEAKHVLLVSFGDVEQLSKKSFVCVMQNHSAYSIPPFTRDRKAWLNYHYAVFRAKAKETTLTISDWASDQEAAGPVGQELMLNFLELQPYFEEERQLEVRN
ncbi:MAG: hypothetical protein HY360_14880 [Verrucomicrobia bacterium]|nr:hypothetical protein [Verrucomicrobiota bacterium]